MSKPKARRTFLDVLSSRRSRSASPAPSVQPASNALASGSAAPVIPTTSPQSNQTAAPKTISRDDVLTRLDPVHQQIICDHSTNSDLLDIGAAVQEAIDAAEAKKQLCVEKRWSITIGGKTIILREKVNSVVDLIIKFKDIDSIAVGADPIHAGLPWAGICLLLQVVVADKEQMDALMNGIIVALSSQQTADLYLDCYNHQPAGAHANNLRGHLLALYATILGFLAEALRLLGANGPTRFFNALLADDSLRKFPSSCRERLGDVSSAVMLCDRQLDKRTAELVANTKKIVTDIADQLDNLLAETIRTRTKIDFANLPTVTSAHYDSYSSTAVSACLHGTRVDLLHDITQWTNDHTGECLFWLQGIAGEGKSTVAKTLATNLQRSNKLGASFFFKSDDIDRADARKFFTTIALQLAQMIEGMEAHIAEILNSQLTGYDKSIQSQFDELIAAPLRELRCQSSQSSLIIVVDGLDECREADIKHVVELLAQCELFGIRSFVTSRPDAPVANVFAHLNHTCYRQLVLRDHTRDTIHHDIALFLEEQFAHLRKEMSTAKSDWPGQDVIEALTERSVPLFIFASTVCAFIAKDSFYGPDEQLEAVLAETSGDRLSQTYLPVLKRLLKDQTPKQVSAIIEEFRNLVGSVVLSAEPMPVEFVITLAGLKSRQQLRARLSRLQSVLHVGVDDSEEDQTVHPFHLSFRDFLIKPDEPHDFQIDERRVHCSIANTCLSLLMEPGNLRQDICAVGKPGTRRQKIDPCVINKYIGPDLAYACQYWLYHQVRSGQSLDDTHRVHHFLTHHFLYWFEAMAWLGRAYEILPVLKQLTPLINNTDSTKLRELFEDIQYFIRDFSYIADQAPLQLYASALTFAPKSSQVKTLFNNCMPQWLVLPSNVADVWEANSLILEGHTSWIRGASFSSCEEYLATCAFNDGTLRVWHSATGDCTLIIPSSQHRTPVDVSFSHDNKCLVAAYLGFPYSKKHLPLSAVIYDMETGNVIETYEDIKGELPKRPAVRLAFAPGPGKALLVAILGDGRLEVWRTKLDSYVFERAWGMQTQIESRQEFIISASDSLISCFSCDDRSITSWRLESGAHVGSHSTDLGIHHFAGFIKCQSRDLIYLVRSGATSPDDEQWFQRRKVQKLNTQTGQTDLITYIEAKWRPEAIALTTGAIAYTKHNSGVVYMIDPLQCPKTDDWTSDVGSSVVRVSVSQDGEMILLAYQCHVELQDVLGNTVFRSSKTNLSGWIEDASVSGDGSVITAHAYYKTRVWFVKSGRELQLPRMNRWICSPVVTGDGKLMAFCLAAASKRRGGNWPNVVSEDFMADRMLLWNLEKNQEIKVTDRSYTPSWILFSEDDKTLHTNKGDLDLETGDWKTDSLHVPIEFKRSISDDHYWLQLNGDDMLWLPNSHRPETSKRFDDYFGKNTIAYRCQDGSVVVMSLVDPSE